MQKQSPNSNPPILSSTHGATIVSGGLRLSHEEELALNVMLHRHLGDTDGMPNYKIGWAIEDNHSTWDATTGSYKYDPDVRTPICFHENQASYHLLAWEPPTSSPALGQIKGEDTSKGTYNCVFHFVDKQTGDPYSPSEIKVQLLEIVIPTMKEINQLALASRKGYEATAARLRRATIDRIKTEEKRQEQEYAEYATNLLENEAPAFEGNPFAAGSGKRGRNFADLKLGESLKNPNPQSEPTVQPSDFAFSVKSRKKE